MFELSKFVSYTYSRIYKHRILEYNHDPIRELTEIRNQLSYSKRLGFLFGAGTSKAMGISDISALTQKVEGKLEPELKAKWSLVKNALPEEQRHIEAILNQVRLIRQITSDSQEKSFEEITGDDAKKLDKAICDEIYKIITEEEASADLRTAKRFVGWLNWISRDYAKEIFTTNYDLILEKSAENLLIPFFDGFVGSNEPFFSHESLNNSSSHNPPKSWIRLWKLHGSLGWFWKESDDKKSHRVVRLGARAKENNPDVELVIYPSKEKYETSRKQPFISCFDRLKEFLNEGEGIFIISGYSFSDEHVNEVIFSALNQNSRLHVLAFFFVDEPIERIVGEGRNLPNLTLIGPKKASISGTFGEWKKETGGELLKPFWKEDDESLTLGDFKALVEFLILSSGVNTKIIE